MKGALALITISTLSFLFGSSPALALDPSLEVSQYAHTAWTVRNGFSLGNILRDGPDARRVSLARHGIRPVSLRWRSQLSPGNHPRVSISLQSTLTACSSRATALFGLARLLALQPGVAES